MTNPTREVIQRDLNAHAAARAAVALWNEEYAAGRLGLMGFWDTLTPSQKSTAARIADEIRKARPYTGRKP